jgi:hypothetical protein
MDHIVLSFRLSRASRCCGSKLTPYPRWESKPVPEPTRHGHHPSTGDAPSSPAADASDAGANDARNGVRREIHEIEDALKAFKIAVEAGRNDWI